MGRSDDIDDPADLAHLQDVPRGLIEVRNPNSPLVRARREQLSRRYFELQAHRDQLRDELKEIAQQLTALGGVIGGYATYANQIQPLNNADTRRAVRRQTNYVMMLAYIAPLVGIALVVVGIILGILIIIGVTA